jgi:group I intron endonuclease
MVCIYKATNILNGKSYIGYTKNFTKRKNIHKNSALRKNINFVFYQAIRKYGWDNFKWEVIYESWDQKHCLTIMEPYFIVEHNTFGENGYNMTRGGERGPDTIKRKSLTEEQKKNISIGTKKNALRGEDHPMYGSKGNEKFIQSSKTSMLGKKHSEETRKKQSEVRKEYLKNNKVGMFGKKHSEETKEKMKLKRMRKWELFDVLTGKKIIIDDLMEYSTINNLNYKIVHSWKYKMINGQPRLKRL